MAQWCPQVAPLLLKPSTWTANLSTIVVLLKGLQSKSTEYTKVEHTCKNCGAGGKAYLDNSTSRAVELSMLELRPSDCLNDRVRFRID